MIHIICGAPCAGKSTYVRANASPNETVIDLDSLALSMGADKSHMAGGNAWETALFARNKAIEHVLETGKDAWIIDSLPSSESMKKYSEAKADIVLIETAKDECLKRASERPDGTKEAIEKWFSEAGPFINLMATRANEEKRGKYSYIGGKLMEKEEKNTGHSNEGQGRTFTQEELNAILGERISKEKSKYADYESLKEKAAKLDELEEKNKSALEKANEAAANYKKELEEIKKANSIKEIRTKVSDSMKVPASLLHGTTEDECKTEAKAILEFANPGARRRIRDGGDTGRNGKQSAKDAFDTFMNENF